MIEYFDESGSGVPVAYAAVDALNDVLASETGDRHPEEVRLLIAASCQEWQKALLDLLPSLLLPTDGCLVHFINDNDKLVDTEGTRQPDMLSSLTVLLEAGLELSTSR